MNSRLRTNLYWIIPVVIVSLGLVLLCYQNYSKVTEAPDDDWSRGIVVGETQFNKLPKIRETADGKYVFSFFQDNKLITKELDNDFNMENQTNYEIPVNKWTQVYLHEDQLIWFDFKNIYDENKQQLVTEVDGFYPLNTTVLYVKEKALYQLHPDTKQSVKLMDIDLDQENISLEENQDGIHLMVFKKGTNEVHLALYKLAEEKVDNVYETTLKVDPGKVVNQIAYTFDNQKLSLLLQEELESTQGKPVFFNYFVQTVITDSNTPKQYELTFYDPAQENTELTEVSDVTFIYRDGVPMLLFKANGYTDTKYNEKTTFNIFEAEIGEDGTTKTERRSNTSAISTIPQWVNENTIAWVDLNGDSNTVNVSSSDLDTINLKVKTTSDDWLQALGKTFGMLALSFFALAITFIWFMWPVLFIVILYVIKSRAIDYDRSWVFYTGIVLYLAAVVLFKDRFFIPNLLNNAPDYLTFTGGTYFYLLLFALVAYLLTSITKRVNEWTGAVRVLYFVAVHVVLVTIFYGPYIIY
ncbi:hypothetical protein [Bacillus sp. B1-b2]|uniref:hypothetical protein n=1 Tax=Bacillus sp. B1-b2 TaxID=2653201 RepID=UPI0012616278|nr:hypothetical protein [Bacillus sp. B1-b2]KAB7668887.1 hypothetical protein F9279_11805 [Bacillus sp. B1-b2]